MFDVSLFLDRNVFVGGVTHTIVGGLLAWKVCHLSLKDAFLWSSVGFVLIAKLSESLNLKVSLEGESVGERVFSHIRIGVALSLLAYLSNRAASYLIKVPSNQFAMVTVPLLLIGSMIFSDTFFGKVD